MNAVDPWQRQFAEVEVEWRHLGGRPVPRDWVSTFDDVERDFLGLRRRGAWVTGPRSLLGVLGLRRSEVDHSAILRWVLDPSGAHRLGTRALMSFLTLAGVDVAYDDLLRPTVVTEVPTKDPVSGQSGSIDIVIEAGDKTVLVEVKMWATETGNQLDRYAASHPHATWVFLTPFGSLPKQSPVSASGWKPLSWRRDMIPMLTKVAAESRADGRPVPALEDYVNALSEELNP